MVVKNVAIFASGEGTNAKAIIDYFRNNQHVKVVLIVSDNQNSPVLGMAKTNNINSLIISRDDLKNEDYMLKKLSEYNLSLIILAGFMKIIPAYLVEAYKNRILNIHPAIDRKYDGKTGKTIPSEVIANKDLAHGSRVHIVTTRVDGGEEVDSVSFPVETSDPEELTQQIKIIEHELYPRAVDNFLKKFH